MRITTLMGLRACNTKRRQKEKTNIVDLCTYVDSKERVQMNLVPGQGEVPDREKRSRHRQGRGGWDEGGDWD